MKKKLTSIEKQWVLYDVGNSAFILLVSTIMPIYFNYIAGNAGVSSVDYLAYWGYAASIATLIVAFLGPILGTMADMKNYKKILFVASLLIGVSCLELLGFMSSYIWFLIIFVIAKAGYSASLIFYDSMLTDITTPERMDIVSSSGFAWGYIGSCIPFVIGLFTVLKAESLGLEMNQAMIIAFTITAIWWTCVSMPLIRNYKQKHYIEGKRKPVRESFKRLYKTAKEIKGQKHILMFLLAFFFYIDGVYTIIEMATAYGQSLGLDSTGLLLALLVTQIVAFPSVILFGKLTYRMQSSKIITICIFAYLAIALFAIQLNTQVEFWILAICVGMFQGTIQALSRSYYAKIIPAEKSGEYFGIFDICGKGASFLGTTIVGIGSQLMESTSAGVGALAVLFIIGLFLFHKAVHMNKEAEKEDTAEAESAVGL